MPLNKDVRGGGSEKDGSLSKEYCSKCYHAGRFIDPDMTVRQMQELVVQRLKDMRFPGFIARRFSQKIPGLKRWKST
jgi:hypothetical protein